MTRQTSIDAYNEIKESGLLSHRRFEVYETLFNIGPATAGEISKAQNKTSNFAKGDNSHARLCELRDLGVVKEIMEVKCTVTGMRVIQWGITDKLPSKPLKPDQIKCPHCKGRGYLKQERLL